ncbi:agmatine deiminase family protein [Mariprofundus erugo]|uniref:Agmatine deiminase family protein n=1 Tax=Mariprofundus erugo TaxID=2528639 RepID=A0A5R9GX89_9PROT|nr:agmatine deiminase family protein [Mariprofundus erugo]TLS69269.1 agmatine deiminase family protein [Mariprofundus erugo]TLS76074.1 agmatine deiminase family protein [Mariprofundus erugo]
MNRRLPAEWEPQSGVQLSWPRPDSDWADLLDRVEPCVAAIVAAISRFERVVVVVHDAEAVRPQLEAAGAQAEQVTLIELPANDTWVRDYGALTVEEGDAFRLLDFSFNGWGLKFAANLDNQVSRRLHAAGLFGDQPMTSLPMILEGGSIDSDGAGTILTTSDCLLSLNRNTHLTQAEIEAELCAQFGARRLLWLDHGHLAGDDTDSHVDILARFASPDTIIHMACDDPADAHDQAFAAMQLQLQQFRRLDGMPYHLVALPWPKPRLGRFGQVMAPSYANFLIINGAVLVPTYQDSADAEALRLIGACFPGREVIGIDASVLIEQGGSLHCMTMQFPMGVLS